ncbi:MAG: hypothetical protein OXT65_04920 [Alphaproteobacteria bacterium]|nr:hypothetical protein [Alphaproteobacteria bacterium]
MRFLFLTLLALCFVAYPAMARPVSYPGGWTLMSMNDGDAYTLHWHYSPTARYSLGYKFEYQTGPDLTFNGGQLNILVNRWNKPDSQANLYLKSGAGLAHSSKGAYDNETAPAGFVGLSADWEDRRFFTMYENRIFSAGEIEMSFTQKARIGIAPYIGEYGDLHTWLMLEVRHDPEGDKKFVAAPLVRFFKGTNLLEAGVDTEKKALLNFVHRF